MNGHEVLELLRDAGIRLRLDDFGFVIYRAAPGCFTPELRALARRHQADIAAALRTHNDRGRATQVCCSCGGADLTCYVEDAAGAWWCRACAVRACMVPGGGAARGAEPEAEPAEAEPEMPGATQGGTTVINISHHSTYEDWLVVREDGTIVYHYELDGWAAKKGTKPTDTPITLEQVRVKFPGAATEVERALAQVGKVSR